MFISYSHDSPEHIRAVLELANRLREEGVDCVLDQYESSPPEGWLRWMDSKIRDAKYVILVCTETYHKRVMGEEESGAGHGVRWEGNLIYQHFYDAGTLNTKFVPIVTRSVDKRFVPNPLRGSTVYVLDATGGYDDLYARLTGTAGAAKPPLGKRRALPAKPVKTDPTWFITSPIDVALWDKARWTGTFFLHYEGRPPYLGLAFKDEGAARAIFHQWHERYGARDVDEELRISIVEGDVVGEDPGYTVHVSSDIDVTINRLKRAGYHEDDVVFSVSRLNRMNPAPGSTNLQLFRERYRQFKTYYLIPGVVAARSATLTPIPELGIFKSKVLFRHVDDIKDNDIDVVVVGSGRVKRSKNPDFSDFK
ncbi:MAG: TIR domain-containing protein [Gemmatimonadales bacterium]|nr:TIR domain-containing protein [Gemmatimonadales bacterium]